MTPGPTHIVKIPTTGRLVKIHTMASGNGFGATHWSDGISKYPMMSRKEPLQQRRRTLEVFWLRDCIEVAREWRHRGIRLEEFKEVPYARNPSLADIRLILNSGQVLDSEQKRYLLQRFWHLVNEPTRVWLIHNQYLGKQARTERPKPFRPADFSEKLKQLGAMLNLDDSNDRLCAAEIYRELGDFPMTLQLLKEHTFHQKFYHQVETLRGWAQAGNNNLMQVFYND